VVGLSSRIAVRMQTGYLYTYAFVMLIGLTAAATWAIAS
jgi:NADH-quinone oxidoreductase subunit L